MSVVFSASIFINNSVSFILSLSVTFVSPPSPLASAKLCKKDTDHLEPWCRTEPQAGMTARQHSRTASVFLGHSRKKKEPANAEHKQQLSTWSHRISSTGRGKVWMQKQKISVQLLSSILKYLLVPPKSVFYLGLFPVEMHLLLQSKFKLHDNMLISYLLQSTKK